jgi:elongation factor G
MTRTIPLERYRNIGILASQDAGRTTTTERLLAVTAQVEGAARAAGVVPAWVEQDNHRAITLTSAATSCDWRDCRINIVELSAAGRGTHDEALRVLDGLILVLDAGATIRSEIVDALHLAQDRGLAVLAFVNKLDREGADLDAVVSALGAISRVPVLPLQLTIGAGAGLGGLVDLIGTTATFWPGQGFDAPAQQGSVPATHAAAAKAGRAVIAAEIVGGAELDGATLQAKLRDAVCSGRVLPVLGGSAFRNRGTRLLLDAIVDYLPAPTDLAVAAVDVAGSAVDRKVSDDEPFAGFAFQTVDDPNVGKLTFVRIYSGIVARGSLMLNSVSASPEQVGRLVRMHANHTEEIEEAHAGDIVALEGLRHTTTGDTLCDPAAPVILERRPAVAGRTQH